MIHIQKQDGTVLTDMQKWDILNPCPPVYTSKKNNYYWDYAGDLFDQKQINETTKISMEGLQE